MNSPRKSRGNSRKRAESESRMSAEDRKDATYVLGQSEGEMQRLIKMAQLQEKSTRRMFEDAGIAPDMKVLDVGSGAGDVAMLAGRMVGPTGSVIGVDTNSTVLETARARAQDAGLANVTFVAGDIRTITLDDDFDAVVGRRVLMYQGDPVAALRAIATHLRPGGIVAFQETDWTVEAVSFPPSRHQWQHREWTKQAFEQGGTETSMGFKMHKVFLEAGLESPEMHLEALIGGGPDFFQFDFAADGLRVTLPRLIEYGIATAEEVDVDTFAQRYRAEVVGQQGVTMGFTHICAWSRKR